MITECSTSEALMFGDKNYRIDNNYDYDENILVYSNRVEKTGLQPGGIVLGLFQTVKVLQN